MKQIRLEWLIETGERFIRLPHWCSCSPRRKNTSESWSGEERLSAINYEARLVDLEEPLIATRAGLGYWGNKLKNRTASEELKSQFERANDGHRVNTGE